MSKRNFILLIIILLIVVITIFWFLYFRPTITPGEEDPGTNFFSQFNPFGTSKPKPPIVTPPIDVSGYQPGAGEEKLKLVKVSSMPIAGFTIFTKERLSAPVPILPAVEPISLETNAGIPPKGKVKIGTGTPTPPLTEFMPALRYVDKANGNIYQTFVDKIEERKFSITIIPKVYDAYFGNHGESVIMRYLKTDRRTI